MWLGAECSSRMQEEVLGSIPRTTEQKQKLLLPVEKQYGSVTTSGTHVELLLHL